MNRFFHTATLGLMLFALPSSADSRQLDVDGDGLDDGWEHRWLGSISRSDGQSDLDHDGLIDLLEQQAGTDPLSVDTDDDLLSDGDEVREGTDPRRADTDGDGLTDHAELVLTGTDPTNFDTDGGGAGDGEEVRRDGTDPRVPSDDRADTDGDGLSDFEEIFVLRTDPYDEDSDGDWLIDGDEVARGTHPLSVDSDGDGLSDGWEVLVTRSDPSAADTDGDGIEDGVEVRLASGRSRCLDPLEPDSDFDGLDDGREIEALSTDPCLQDTDGDGVLDASEDWEGTDPADAEDVTPDHDGDGLSDAYEAFASRTDRFDADTDGDGLEDGQEVFGLADRLRTDPLDADTDDDGLLDGVEGGLRVGSLLLGGADPTRFDTDGDDLSDGLERGFTGPLHRDTDPSKARFDRDPSSRTNPLAPDTDGDGLDDGLEDVDHDGWRGASETSPTLADTDLDDLDDGWEVRYAGELACDPAVTQRLDPLDGRDAALDLDGDGLSSRAEYFLPGRTSPCDADTDDDGLLDGVEVRARNATGGSDPLRPDTDGDRLDDGAEDLDQDGEVGEGESDPTLADTDGDGLTDGEEWAIGTELLEVDSDGDELTDGREVQEIGTDPLDADSDGDGLSDGLEVGVDGDLDARSRTDPLDDDSDGDGLLDGLEDLDRDGARGPGEADPLSVDSDEDGLLDGVEDRDRDGLFEPWESETHPGRADSDGGGVDDGEELRADRTDPTDGRDDRTADPDGDGLTNEQEAAIGTDPSRADTDGDTLSDGLEAGWRSTPQDTDGDGLPDCLDADSDGDGLDDADEAGDGDLATSPRDADGDGIPDFQERDSDGGGVDDGTEVLVHGSDPTDPNDDGVGWLEPGARIEGGAGCQTVPPSRSGGLLALLALLALRARRGAMAAALLAGAGANASEAPDARSANLDVNPYASSQGAGGVLSVPSAQMLDRSEVELSVSLQLVDRPLSVVGADGDPIRALVSRRTELDLGAAAGLGRNVEIGGRLAIVVDQLGELPGMGLGETPRRGVGGLTLYAKAALLPPPTDGHAPRLALLVPMLLPTARQDAWMGSGAFEASPRLVLSGGKGPWSANGALGVHLAPELHLFDVHASERLQIGGAAQLRPWMGTLGLCAEALFTTELGAHWRDPSASTLEVAAGVQLPLGAGTRLRVSWGAGLLPGVPSAAARVVISLSERVEPARRELPTEEEGARALADVDPTREAREREPPAPPGGEGARSEAALASGSPGDEPVAARPAAGVSASSPAAPAAASSSFVGPTGAVDR